MKHEEVRKGCTLPCKDRVEDRLSLLKMSPEERDEYFYYMKKTLTDEDAIETATDKGVEEGIKLGVAQEAARAKLAIAEEAAKAKQAIAEEAAKTEIKVQQARAEATAEEAARSEEKVKEALARAEKAKLEVAKAMLKDKVDVNTVAKYTGLDPQTVKDLNKKGKTS